MNFVNKMTSMPCLFLRYEIYVMDFDYRYNLSRSEYVQNIKSFKDVSFNLRFSKINDQFFENFDVEIISYQPYAVTVIAFII